MGESKRPTDAEVSEMNVMGRARELERARKSEAEMLEALLEAAEVLAIGASPPKKHGAFKSWVERRADAERKARAAIKAATGEGV